MIRALDQLREFPVPTVAGAVLVDGAIADSAGPLDHRFRLASIAKTDHRLGDPDRRRRRASLHSTTKSVRHRQQACGRCVICSPTPAATASTGPSRSSAPSATGSTRTPASRSPPTTCRPPLAMPFGEYLRLGLLEPLGMTATELTGSPAHAMWSSVDDVIRVHAGGHRTDTDLGRDRRTTQFVRTSPRWEVSFRAWDVSTRARGEWGSRSVGTSLPTGPERVTLRRRTGTSVEPAP